MKKIPYLLLVLAVVLAVYANHYRNEFHFDDFHTIRDNQYIRDLKNIPLFFKDGNTFSVLPSNRTYRPMVSTSLAIDYWAAQHFANNGYDVRAYNISTMAWFLLQLVMMYLLFVSILDKTRPQADNRAVAAFAVAWYGVHPAIAETVNYVIQRGDIYSTLGVVMALVVYIRYPSLRRYGLYLIPVLFATLSKPPALFFPLFLLLYILHFENEGEDKGVLKVLAKLTPALVFIGAMAWVNKMMTPKSFAADFYPKYEYQLTQPYVWWRYCKTFFLPNHLSADSDLALLPHWSVEMICGVLFVAMLITVACFLFRRPSLRPISFGLFWTMLALLPTSLYTLAEVENDHRMYFPFVGLTLAVTWAIAKGLEKPFQQTAFRKTVYACAVLMLSAYAYETGQRNQVWRTEESLWLDVAQKSPKNGRGLMNYGLSQMEKGRYVEALSYFERAQEYLPTYTNLAINLGIANGALGHTEEAETQFHRAMALGPQDAQAYFYYARWLKDNGRWSEARAMDEIAVQLNPAWGDSQTLLVVLKSHVETAEDLVNSSLILYRQKRYQESIAMAQRALQKDPKSSTAYNNISADYAALGLWDNAIENSQAALKLNPQFAIARNNLMWQITQRNNSKMINTPEEWLDRSLHHWQAGMYQESILDAKQALRLRPEFAEAYNNLAAAYQSLHQWDQAIAAAQEAVRLKPDFQLAKNNLVYSLEQKKLAKQH